MITEIREEKVEEADFAINKEAQKQKIRKIIEYQKSCLASSSSSSSSSSSYKSRSLLNLMKGGSTSLRRLFDMEHTSLATYFRVYSGSPIIKPILLWGSDTDNEKTLDPWESINDHLRNTVVVSRSSSDGENTVVVSRSSSDEENTGVVSSMYEKSNLRNSKSNRKLTRKKTFRKLPRRFRLWSCSKGFRLGMNKLTRLRIVICERIWPSFNNF